jgi:hypothetical protein
MVEADTPKLAPKECHGKGILGGGLKNHQNIAKCLILIGLVATPFRLPGLGPNQALSTPFSNYPEISLVKVFLEGSNPASPKTACKGFSST